MTAPGRLLARITALTALALLASLASCTFGRVLRYRESAVDDWRIFDARAMHPSPMPFAFVEAPDAATRRINVTFGGRTFDLDEEMAKNDTLALLVLHHDKLVYERYFNGHSRKERSMSFSMAKSFTSILLGQAIADGKIALDEPVTERVPELAERGFDRVRLAHLLQMTGGTNYRENDWPTGRHPHFYYTEHLAPALLRLRVVDEPGTAWRYRSGETQLLGLALSRALAPETITSYMDRRLWMPLGMESEGYWSLDSDEGGLEKVFCCLAARARDFLKFGRLMLRQGDWQGTQLVPREWVAASTSLDETEGSPWDYQYAWWIADPRDGDFFAGGHLGQYLYVSPKRDAVVLRLGTSRGKWSREEWRSLLPTLLDDIVLTDVSAIGS
ncbi:MAG: serine hydrolase [Deltaproteobacteria bacterium]|nr:serine hydrolase [Deltaproteobacteria bacterium]